jgi:hypothetical protein
LCRHGRRDTAGRPASRVPHAVCADNCLIPHHTFTNAGVRRFFLLRGNEEPRASSVAQVAGQIACCRASPRLNPPRIEFILVLVSQFVLAPAVSHSRIKPPDRPG